MFCKPPYPDRWLRCLRGHRRQAVRTLHLRKEDFPKARHRDSPARARHTRRAVLLHVPPQTTREAVFPRWKAQLPHHTKRATRMSDQYGLTIGIKSVRLSDAYHWHGQKQKVVTDEHYEINYAPLKTPGFVQFRDRKTEQVFLMSFTNILSMEVLPDCTPQHAVVGTRPAYDTPSGRKKNFRKKD